MKLTFDGFKELAEAIDKAGLDLDDAAGKALTKTSEYIDGQVSSAAAPYASGGLKGYATGKMYSAKLDRKVGVWKRGSVYWVNVGFGLRNGGYHSIFVMWGTPRIAKDMRLWQSIFGGKTKSEIARIQKEVMSEYLRLGGK